MKSFTLFIRIGLPLCAILFIGVCRFVPSLAEEYAQVVYPVLSSVLSWGASFLRFSLEEVFVIGVLLVLVFMPICKSRLGITWKRIIVAEAEVLAWVYIWFYLGWGLNYFRYDIYTRMQVIPVSYDEQKFMDFLQAYTDSLNATYSTDVEISEDIIFTEVQNFYDKVYKEGGLLKLKSWQSPKYFTFTSLYSSVGVLGSMGPFFSEAQLNRDLLPLQLPFTYAHEVSHLLGVSSEAEANYWAYRACVESSSSSMRYCGYFGLLPYVISNASSLLTEEDFRQWINKVRPEVLEDYTRGRSYWQEKYSPLVGSMQEWVYNLFLKGNRISSGKKNYAEVIGILLSMKSES